MSDSMEQVAAAKAQLSGKSMKVSPRLRLSNERGLRDAVVEWLAETFEEKGLVVGLRALAHAAEVLDRLDRELLRILMQQHVEVALAEYWLGSDDIVPEIARRAEAGLRPLAALLIDTALRLPPDQRRDPQKRLDEVGS